MFIGDPLNIAPAAGRPTREAWLAVLAAVCFLLFCAFLLELTIRASEHAQEQAKVRAETLRLRAQQEAEARQRASDPAALEKLRARQEVQQALGISWSGMLETFELAAKKLGGGVSLTSISSVKAVAVPTETRVAGMALSNDSLLQYLEVLKAQPLVKDVRLLSHTTGHSAAVATSRFQLVVTWHPRLSVWTEGRNVQ